MYKLLIRPLLFKFDPETIHKLLIFFLKTPLISKILKLTYNYKNPTNEKVVFGLTFKNPVGLAAGFDKNAEIVNQLSDLGFGFVEIGTVTPKPQPGNDPPRIFRLPQDKTIINRMGFNNDGVELLRSRLQQQKPDIIVGGNIGKNKMTSNEDAYKDYILGFETLFDFVDYFVVNVSSPNTPDLRELQEKQPLTKLLSDLQILNRQKPVYKPILLKIAPDLTDRQLDDIVDIVANTGIAGVIATNTTIARENLRAGKNEIEKIGAGGLSGIPLRNRSTEVIRYISKKSGGKIPIIGVGGIHSAEDAIEKLTAGASLIQIYTGFIYEGPGLIKKINKKIAALNESDAE